MQKEFEGEREGVCDQDYQEDNQIQKDMPPSGDLFSRRGSLDSVPWQDDLRSEDRGESGASTPPIPGFFTARDPLVDEGPGSTQSTPRSSPSDPENARGEEEVEETARPGEGPGSTQPTPRSSPSDPENARGEEEAEETAWPGEDSGSTQSTPRSFWSDLENARGEEEEEGRRGRKSDRWARPRGPTNPSAPGGLFPPPPGAEGMAEALEGQQRWRSQISRALSRGDLSSDWREWVEKREKQKKAGPGNLAKGKADAELRRKKKLNEGIEPLPRIPIPAHHIYSPMNDQMPLKERIRLPSLQHTEVSSSPIWRPTGKRDTLIHRE